MVSPGIESLDSFIGWVVGIIGVLAAILTPVLMRKTGKETTIVNEKDASTRAVGQVIEALSVGLSELRLEVDELKTKNGDLENTVAGQGATIRQLVQERGEMVAHIELLEETFPYPPGAPNRPQWLKNLN